ncbi:MAG: GGDEF domain-containing protein [Acidobacteria bacterium]|nr:GGDEF domain-containing protein [Acidobacteriota bacterium]
MESLEGADVRFRQTLGCYLSALCGVQEHVFELLAAKSSGPALSVKEQADALRVNPDSQALEAAQTRLAELLERSAGQIRSHLAGRADLEEVLALLSSARASLTGSSESSVIDLSHIASNLDAATKLGGIEELRALIRLEAQHVNELVARMRLENQRMLLELDEEMNLYRRRLRDVADSANRDLLTGLANRRLLYDRLAEITSPGGPVCLLLIDFNRFKRINDTHGHLAGDELLRAFSARLLKQLRQDDTAARWGGDEFVIVLPCRLEDAIPRSKGLEQSLEGDYRIRIGGKDLRIRLTLSIGIAEYRPGETVDQLLARADQALYSHKHR